MTIDLADWGTGMSSPNMDTRSWVSYGVVEGSAEANDEPCVKIVQGQPLVRVMLHPDLIPAYCRIATRFAGKGEAEYVPFFPGDEVIVVLPEGSARAGGVILGKLNNEIDSFPTESVAGQDPTKNDFAFRRSATAHIEEYLGPVTLRSAGTGAMISLDEVGQVTLRAGNAGVPTAAAGALRIGLDVVGLQNADGTYLLQLNLTDKVFLMRAGDAMISLADTESKKPSTLLVPQSLTIGTSGNAPLEHFTSTEAQANVLANVFVTFAAAVNSVPVVGTALSTAILLWLSTGAYAASFTAASTGANVPAQAAYALALEAITAAFAASTQKPNTPGGQLLPGLGFAGTLGG